MKLGSNKITKIFKKEGETSTHRVGDDGAVPGDGEGPAGGCGGGGWLETGESPARAAAGGKPSAIEGQAGLRSERRRGWGEQSAEISGDECVH